MRYKTAFRLALKVIGVYFVLFHLPWFTSLVVRMPLMSLVNQANPAASIAGTPSWIIWEIPQFIYNFAGLALGLYLFFGGRWIVNLAIPSNRHYCHECGYEIRGLPAEGECPECGVAYRVPAERRESQSNRERSIEPRNPA